MLCIGVAPASRRPDCGLESRVNSRPASSRTVAFALKGKTGGVKRRREPARYQIMLIVTVTHLPVGIVVTSLMTYGASFVIQKMLWLLLA
jgi:hypothetical protein